MSFLTTNQITNIVGRYFPNTVKIGNTASYKYWERSLYQRICSKLLLTVPEEWEGGRKDFLLYCLIRIGFVMVSESENLGYWFNPCSLSGQDFYYQPTDGLLANPNASQLGLKSSYKLHEEAEILKFMPDFAGFNDTIAYYAEELASVKSAINVSLINTKMPYILAGKNKAVVAALQKILDKISNGEPAVFIDEILSDQNHKDGESPFQVVQLMDVARNYITDKLLMDFQTIINSFDAEIGINTVPYQKAERFVTAEAESKSEDSQARIITAVECMKSSIKEIKKLYPDIKLDIALRESKKEVQQNGNSENNPDRDV